jgi:DNA topoisomerase-1
MKTGIRPGGEEDTKAKVKAYGATTLETQHVKIKGGRVFLDFIGKKGVHQSIPIDDDYLAAFLRGRARRGAGERIFDVDSIKLLSYTSSLDGGGFKTKDFRTLIGTKTAINEIKSTDKKPSNEKEYKKMVMNVAKRVSEKLGNTPSVALKVYIHPIVWQDWKSAIS